MGNILSENAIRVLERRYLKKDIDGKVIETPEGMFRRVAKAIAEAEKQYKNRGDIEKIEESFYTMMARLEFLPNSPTLMNAGRELGQLSACFVMPVPDSMEGIFTAVKESALIQKAGGGVGFSFSELRPKNDIVMTTKGVASGPVSFMSVFDAAAASVKQGGTRRAAMIGILSVDHPDILDFIVAKKDNISLTNFNISVAVTDKFMSAVEKGDDYELINSHTQQVVKKLNARMVFDLLSEMAWRNGDPGIIFIDTINKSNPTPQIGVIEATNPCGEVPMLSYESCNLGSINLSHIVKDKKIDFDKLEKTVKLAVQFLDDVIDVNNFHLEQIKRMTLANRKIGLGVMGFADLLIQLSIPYDSEEAVQTAERVMRFIQEKARETSAILAEERGIFPNYKGSIYDGVLKMRNATVTTIAPTGTLSIIANCSSGIEPIFAISYIRTGLDKDHWIETHPLFEQIARERGFYREGLMEEIAKKGSIKGIEGIPIDIQRLFVTAHDILPEWHVRIQAAFQKYTDNAVSKTVNLPHDATVEDVKKVYLMAYKNNCKGITIYRDKSREGQVLNIPTATEIQTLKADGRIPRPRPEITHGATVKIKTGCGNLYITINEDKHGLSEVFSQIGKSGGCSTSQSEAIGRLISLALRSGIEVEAILKQLKGIRCPAPLRDKGEVILSCPDAIEKAIERYLNKSNGKSNSTNQPDYKSLIKTHEVVGVCSDCGVSLIQEGRCIVCRGCGYSKC